MDSWSILHFAVDWHDQKFREITQITKLTAKYEITHPFHLNVAHNSMEQNTLNQTLHNKSVKRIYNTRDKGKRNRNACSPSIHLYMLCTELTNIVHNMKTTTNQWTALGVTTNHRSPCDNVIEPSLLARRWLITANKQSSHPICNHLCQAWDDKAMNIKWRW